jgi:hypothetical protein
MKADLEMGGLLFAEKEVGFLFKVTVQPFVSVSTIWMNISKANTFLYKRKNFMFKLNAILGFLKSVS